MTFATQPAACARPRNRVAMTLLELLVAVSIGGLVLAVIGFMYLNTLRSFAAIGNYAELDNASRNALDVLSRDVRQSRSLTAFTTNQITLVANDSNSLTFAYSPVTQFLVDNSTIIEQ